MHVVIHTWRCVLLVRVTWGAPLQAMPINALNGSRAEIHRMLAMPAGDALAAYNILRAFSWQIRLSPFAFEELCAALFLSNPSPLMDELHVSCCLFVVQSVLVLIGFGVMNIVVMNIVVIPAGSSIACSLFTCHASTSSSA